MTHPRDPAFFRRTLGHYPTGVCLIAARLPDSAPVGMVVGSFGSVSLDPPLIAFFPARASSTWPRIRAAGRCCVTVLAEDQEALCRRLAGNAPDKFDGVALRAAPNGAPVLAGAVAWIACDIHAVHDAGDHEVVLGLVTARRRTPGHCAPAVPAWRPWRRRGAARRGRVRQHTLAQRFRDAEGSFRYSPG